MDKTRDNLAKLSISYTPDSFVQAAANNDPKVLQLFVDAGMTIDTKNEKDETALMTAAKKGNTETLDWLLQAKANVNAISSQGETALSATRSKAHNFRLLRSYWKMVRTPIS
ncbi:MAG: ankyrin repeat domain-containing protein [Paenibacillaceae bacterium]|nr:ankyrin repeat domain-containing protein [Paenibacillaceae bacterium]